MRFKHNTVNINIQAVYNIYIRAILKSHKQTGVTNMNYYDEDDNKIYVDEREDEDGRLDSQANHDSMVGACDWE